MLYKLCDYEQNGYHDSYFYWSIYDSEKEDIIQYEYGATAYGSTKSDLQFEKLTKDIVEKAISLLSDHIFNKLQADALEPSGVENGEKVKLLKDVKFKNKKTGKTIEASAGTVGKVFWQKAYGQFYANGYNRPNRDNTNLGIEFESGEIIFTGLKNVSRSFSQEEIREKANNLARECQFQTYNSSWSGWTSQNFALAILNS